MVRLRVGEGGWSIRRGWLVQAVTGDRHSPTVHRPTSHCALSFTRNFTRNFTLDVSLRDASFFGNVSSTFHYSILHRKCSHNVVVSKAAIRAWHRHAGGSGLYDVGRI
jgi:hypothetical protein